jgi:hypothetical protein
MQTLQGDENNNQQRMHVCLSQNYREKLIASSRPSTIK